MSYLTEVKRYLAEHPILNLSGHFYPCTEEEITELEKQVGLKLPKAYREFLLWSGNGLGSFEIGSVFFYKDELVEIQEIAREIMDADDLVGKPASPDKLPDDAYIFWMHEGYMFTFFRTSEGDNPPVHFFREGENRIRWNYQEHFTDFLLTEMNNHVKWAESSRQIQDEIARDWTRG